MYIYIYIYIYVCVCMCIHDQKAHSCSRKFTSLSNLKRPKISMFGADPSFWNYVNDKMKYLHHLERLTVMIMILRRCPWCNGYCRRKWTWRHEFKSRTRLIAFHIALIPLGKVWIQLFSLQLWVNSRADWFFSHGEATSLGEGKLWIQTC